jgi:hypothetical protein
MASCSPEYHFFVYASMFNVAAVKITKSSFHFIAAPCSDWSRHNCSRRTWSSMRGRGRTLIVSSRLHYIYLGSRPWWAPWSEGCQRVPLASGSGHGRDEPLATGNTDSPRLLHFSLLHHDILASSLAWLRLVSPPDAVPLPCILRNLLLLLL